MTDEKKLRGTDWNAVSDEELARELARRRAGCLAQTKMLAAEEAVEAHAHRDGEYALQAWFELRMREQNTEPKTCPKCGRGVAVKAKDRERTIRTMSAELTLRRHYHYCERCQCGFYPLDIELGLAADGEYSPKMSARILDLGVTSTFDEAARRWSVHPAGSCISDNAVRLVVERAGRELQLIPAQERHQALSEKSCDAIVSGTEIRLVAQADGSMLQMRAKSEWNEAKLGLVYRQDHHVPGEEHQRGVISRAHYAASMRGIDDFRVEFDAALQAQGALEATQIVCLGDGAAWIWNMFEELCPHAITVLDFMHMKQHAIDCGKAVLGDQSPWLDIWTHSIVDRIDRGQVTQVLIELKELQLTLRGDACEAVKKLIHYYDSNASRMNYTLYRELHIPIGSGAVESAHKHLIQVRMKLAGQHWSPQGAQQMLLLRAAYKTLGPENFNNHLASLAA